MPVAHSIQSSLRQPSPLYVNANKASAATRLIGIGDSRVARLLIIGRFTAMAADNAVTQHHQARNMAAMVNPSSQPFHASLLYYEAD
jgi:hypothetical protein